MAVEMGEEAMRVVVRVAVMVVKVEYLLMMAVVKEADEGTGVVEISAVLTEEVGRVRAKVGKVEEEQQCMSLSRPMS